AQVARLPLPGHQERRDRSALHAQRRRPSPCPACARPLLTCPRAPRYSTASLVDLRGAAQFWPLMSEMRRRWPDEGGLSSWRSTWCIRRGAALRHAKPAPACYGVALPRLAGALLSTRSRCSETARSCSTTATALGSRASCRNAGTRATPTGPADGG